MSRLSVVMLTGSFPPERCGVGDYTEKLLQALKRLGIKVNLVTGHRWNLLALKDISERVYQSRSSLVHIQYPTVGYGAGLAPHALCLSCRSPVIVTLHEFASGHLLRRLSCLGFSLRSDHLIFPTEAERTAFCRLGRVRRERSSVIPVGSNIPALTGPETRNGRICFFGLLVPKQSLRDFLRLVRLCHERATGYEFEIIGSSPREKRYQGFVDSLKRENSGLPIRWRTDLSPADVATALSDISYAYLPYPDGASLRRGSLLAALSNGVAVVTTDSAMRPAGLEKAVRFASDPEHALAVFMELKSAPDITSKMSCEGKIFSKQFDWNTIAQRHFDLYVRVLAMHH